VPAKAAPKKITPKASVIEVDDDDETLESASEDEEAELSTFFLLTY